MIAYFNCKFELHITKKQAEQGSHPGKCDEDIKAELSEYGARDTEELSDHEANKARILWIACGNIMDEVNGC